MGKPERIDPRPFIYLALGLVAWWFVPGVVRGFFRDTFYEFQAPLVLAQSHLQDLQRYWEKRVSLSRHELIEINRDLARSNAALSLQVNQLQAFSRENNRLEALLGLPSRPDYRTVIARVARRDLNTWWQRLVVRRGSVDGIRPGCPVVTGAGVVGRVIRVHHFTCEVELLSDPNFRISANIDGDERPAVYQGIYNAPFTPPLGTITHLPADYTYTPDANAPVNVFTSGVGGVYPGGLPIGVVTGELAVTSDGLFLEGRVQLHPHLSILEEVAILVPLKPDPGETLL